jgi:hypothetical protein
LPVPMKFRHCLLNSTEKENFGPEFRHTRQARRHA